MNCIATDALLTMGTKLLVNIREVAPGEFRAALSKACIRIKNLQLKGGLEQGLMFMLAMKVHQAFAELDQD